MTPALDRRTLLRGAGAALALPWLEAFAPQSSAPPAAPPRLAILVMPNGVLPSAWRPEPAAGGGYRPSFALEPLGELQPRVSVLRRLANENSFDGDGHYAKLAPLLTGQAIRRTGGRDLHNGVSMDQLAAQQLGQRTRLPSLELGCDGIYPVEDMGYSSVYGGSIAWSAADRPCSKEIVPRRVFDRLFGAANLADDGCRESVLDVVKQDADRLRRRLGTRDNDKLTEYLDSVRAIELRLEAASRHGKVVVDAAAAPPPGVPADYPTHLELMCELITLAFATDSTRIVTFLMANEVSGRDFGFLEGCAGGFHEFSHHEGKADKQEAYRRINRFYVAQFTKLLAKLNTPGADGSTLLDSTMVVLAAAMSDGNEHSPHDLPVLLAGGEGLGIPQGRLVTSPRDTPLCSLWLALLQRLGVDAAAFGDADRPLF
ncbi:MAG: DUF1552 domain-containing protein [Planctomycetes bacterium]|nr:DUF1552 domain-containing protein [Planctomycetota bacterium]